jgi:hypothetical protein
MPCQQPHSLTRKPRHGTRGALLAVLGMLLTANAVCQNQPPAPANTQAQTPATTPTNQTKRPAAAPATVAKPPATPAPPPPKPSMMDKARSLFGMKKSTPDTNSDTKSDTNKPAQSHSLFDLFHSHSSNAEKPTPNAPGGATNAGRTPPNQPAERPRENTPAPAARGPTNPPAARPPANVSAPTGGARPGVSTVSGVATGNETHLANGNVARFASDGSVKELHSPQNNMSIHYGMNGSRQIRVDQADGSRVVLASRGVPYVQKPWNFGSRTFDHRTYVDNGVLTHEFYRPYPFGRTTLDAYAPQRFYSQDFYKWVAKPQMWKAPAWTYVATQEPWYTHYQTYFTPQSSYASPLFWLTDFVLATSLFEAYNAHPLPAQAPPSIPAASLPQSSAQQSPIPFSPLIRPPIAPNSPGSASPTPTPPGAAPVPPTPTPAAPIVPPPVIPVPQPANPPSTDAQGPPLTIWQRITNYFQGLFGQTPVQAAASPPEPVVAVGAAPITDEVKTKVMDEVQAQIDEESREAGGNARGLEPKAGAGGIVEELARPSQHVLVVASDLDLVDDTGRRCMISEGDVVQILSAADAESGTAPAVVLSSKGGTECAQAAKVDIGVSDLQEMQNHMRATIDQGLANTPRTPPEPTVTPAFAQAAPPPDADAKSEIEKQKTLATTVERG